MCSFDADRAANHARGAGRSCRSSRRWRRATDGVGHRVKDGADALVVLAPADPRQPHHSRSRLLFASGSRAFKRGNGGVVRRELMHTCIAIASPHGIRRVSTHRQVRMRCTSGTDNFFPLKATVRGAGGPDMGTMGG